MKDWGAIGSLDHPQKGQLFLSDNDKLKHRSTIQHDKSEKLRGGVSIIVVRTNLEDCTKIFSLL